MSHPFAGRGQRLRLTRENVTRERVRTELREVVKLLEAAEGIADGLVQITEHAYDHDHSAADALRAANTAAVAIGEARKAAEDRAEAFDGR